MANTASIPIQSDSESDRQSKATTIFPTLIERTERLGNGRAFTNFLITTTESGGRSPIALARIKH